MKVYLANGLFSLGDRYINEIIAKEIRGNIDGVDLFVPQEQGINDKSSYADAKEIYRLDTENVKSADVVVAVIDGVEIDSGVACEIGIATALGIPVIGLYSDIRKQGTDNMKKINALMHDSVENQFMYRNLYVVGAIKSNGKIVSTIEEVVDAIQGLT